MSILLLLIFLTIQIVTGQQVCTGDRHSCALSSQGKVRCWGYNAHGQLGYGDTLTRGDGPGEMGSALPFVDLGVGTPVDIICGYDHTCVRFENSQIKCWGRNDRGQLGYGDTENRGDGPGEMGANLQNVDFGSLRTTQKAVTGPDFTCVLMDDGNVKCWGLNDSGQLGIGSTTNLLSAPTNPISLALSNSVTDISAGAQHVCVVFNTKQAQCWGGGSAGNLGYGDTTNRGDGPGEMGTALPFIDLGSNQQVEFIEAGSSGTCAVLSSGDTKCWGYNDDGELGYNPAVSGNFIVQMGDNLDAVDFGSAGTPIDIDLGNAETCALFSGGNVKCYGGVPGVTADEPNDVLPFLNLGTGVNVDFLDMTSQHRCAIVQPGDAVKCWGRGGDGRLGTGNTQNCYSTGSCMGDNLLNIDLSEPPTSSPTTRAPTTRAPTGQPTTRAPTTRAPTGQPTTRTPTGQPTTRAPTGQPTTRSPTGQPTTRAVENNSTGVIIGLFIGILVFFVMVRYLLYGNLCGFLNTSLVDRSRNNKNKMPEFI